MKGLFLKDLKILLMQKKSLILFIAVGIFLMLGDNRYGFAVGYTVFLANIMAMGTMSYDSFDNGMAFLFTLPVSRKEYVYEKYGLSVLVTFVADIIITVCGVVFFSQQGTVNLTELLVISGVMFIMALLCSALMFPLNIKYGAEKGRTVMIILLGGIAVIALCVERLFEGSEQILINALHTLAQMDERVLIAGGIGVSVVIFVVSVYISTVILTKKEY